MNGKGDKLRKGANLKAYYDNYDKIFRKQITTEAGTRCNEEKSKSTEPKREMESSPSPSAI